MKLARLVDGRDMRAREHVVTPIDIFIRDWTNLLESLHTIRVRSVDKYFMHRRFDEACGLGPEYVDLNDQGRVIMPRPYRGGFSFVQKMQKLIGQICIGLYNIVRFCTGPWFLTVK
jgi:hypothetical protein